MTLFRVWVHVLAVRELALWLVLVSIWLCAHANSAEPPSDKPVVDTPVGRRVSSDLAAYYASCKAGKPDSKLVSYREMARRLSSDEPAARQEAGEYLRVLCLQTAADDRSGRAPQPRGMKIGGGPNNYGEELRGWMSDVLSEAELFGDGGDAFQAAWWLYQHDPWPDHRENAVNVLARIRTPEADKSFAEILARTDGNFAILTTALRQVAARKLSATDSQIRPLCRHYHPDVRIAALDAADRLGLKDVAAYDPKIDMGPRIEPWLREVLAALPDQVPPGAKWNRFTILDPWRNLAADEAQKTVEVCGWLIHEKEQAYEVLDWTGHLQTWDKKETEMRPDSLQEFSQRMVTLRESFNSSEDADLKEKLKERFGIRTFMSSTRAQWGGTLPEVLTAAWSLDRGDRESCVRLMIPLLKGASDETSFLDHLRDQIAVEVDMRMLGAFTSRDFGEALRLSQLLSRPWFNGFEHQDRAKGLAATLPQRKEDFKALALVSPKAWKVLQKESSRREQVEYLAKRLRLISARQWGIPGGIDYSAGQELAQIGLEKKVQDDPSAPPKDREAINPYCELLRMNLTGEEMLLLTPYLESPDYILAFDLYRFIPNHPHELQKVSWVAAAVFNGVSQQDLVDFDLLDDPSATARRIHLEQIRKWCKDNAAVTHADHLAKAVQEAKEWQDVRIAFWGLREHDEDRAIKLIVSRCEKEAAHRADLARLLCLLDRKEFLPRAREWMEDKNHETRFWGALLALKHGDPKHPVGLEIVLETLTAAIEETGKDDGRKPFGDDAASLVDGAVETLLAVDDPRVRKFFTTYCGSKPYRKFDPSSETLERLFLAGYDAALDRVLYHLADKSPAYQGSKKPRSDNWLWWISYWRYQDPPEFLYDLSEEKRAEAYQDLTKWLGTQFRRIKDGKPSDLIKRKLDPPWGDWKTYSSGWIRRI